MAKGTNSRYNSAQLITRYRKRAFESKEGGVGYELTDIPEILIGFMQKIINRRYDRVEALIHKRLQREADRLFLLVANAIGVGGALYNPYENPVWPRLSRPYAKRKGHERMWYYKGILREWLLNDNNKPSAVFGEPRIDIVRNEDARGWQTAVIQVNPYPEVRDPRISNELIRYRLFGRRKAYGTYISNEELRPILSPTIKYILKNRLLGVVKSTIKEGMENGS